MIYETNSSIETEEIGKKLTQNVKPGDVFCLKGDLGAGKTVFAKGFASGLGIKSEIPSPTFTILNEYHSGRLSLFHFDLYRLRDQNELFGIGYEEYFYGDGVTIIEWPEIAGSLVPQNATFITFEADFNKNPCYRRITVENTGT